MTLVNLKDVWVFDRRQSARKLTDEGHLVAPGIVAKAGIYTYRADELGLPGGAKIVDAYRPPEEVFAPASMASLEGKTVTYLHPEKDVDAKNWRSTAVGDCHGVRKLNDEDLGVDRIFVRDANAIRAVDEDGAELSCGYKARIEIQDGKTPNGAHYDCVVRDIRYNHLAIVPKGRGGSNVKLADQGPKKMAVRLVKGLPFEFDDKQTAAVDILIHDCEEATTQCAALQTKLATEVDAYKAQLSDAQKSADPTTIKAIVSDVFAAIKDARALDADFKTDSVDPVEIRRAALAAIKDDGTKALRDAFVGDLSKAPADILSRCLSGLAVAKSQAPATRIADHLFGAALSSGSQSTDISDTGCEIRDARAEDFEPLKDGE